ARKLMWIFGELGGVFFVRKAFLRLELPGKTDRLFRYLSYRNALVCRPVFADGTSTKIRSSQHRRRDAPVLHGLRDERHHRARASRRARRLEAGAAARALRDARRRARLEPKAQQVRRRRRRSAEETPSARRLVGVRGARPSRPAVDAPLSPRRRPGKLW